MTGVVSTSVAAGLVAALVAVAALLSSATTIEAHGADWEARVIGQKVGGYDVTVRTEPKPPRVGRLHIEVQLINPGNLTYVGDATVMATARFQGEGVAQAGPARSTYQRPWYGMDLNLTESGPWRIHLTIDGLHGKGEIQFPVDIQPNESGAWQGIVSPGLLLPLVTVGVTFTLIAGVIFTLIAWGWRNRMVMNSVDKGED